MIVNGFNGRIILNNFDANSGWETLYVTNYSQNNVYLRYDADAKTCLLSNNESYEVVFPEFGKYSEYRILLSNLSMKLTEAELVGSTSVTHTMGFYLIENTTSNYSNTSSSPNNSWANFQWTEPTSATFPSPDGVPTTFEFMTLPTVANTTHKIIEDNKKYSTVFSNRGVSEVNIEDYKFSGIYHFHSNRPYYWRQAISMSSAGGTYNCRYNMSGTITLQGLLK